MINKLEVTVLVIICVIFGSVGVIMLEDSSRYIKYDCKYVDIMPDMPEQVKRACRSRK